MPLLPTMALSVSHREVKSVYVTMTAKDLQKTGMLPSHGDIVIACTNLYPFTHVIFATLVSDITRREDAIGKVLVCLGKNGYPFGVRLRDGSFLNYQPAVTTSCKEILGSFEAQLMRLSVFEEDNDQCGGGIHPAVHELRAGGTEKFAKAYHMVTNLATQISIEVKPSYR